jgi:hypothetical protein
MTHLKVGRIRRGGAPGGRKGDYFEILISVSHSGVWRTKQIDYDFEYFRFMPTGVIMKAPAGRFALRKKCSIAGNPSRK